MCESAATPSLIFWQRLLLLLETWMELEARARLARDSLIHHLNKRKKGSGDSYEEEDKEEEEEDSSEEARVSRLFYLQLYSSVLKASDEIRRNRRKRKKKGQGQGQSKSSAKEVSKVLQRSFSWMDVTRRVLNRQEDQDQQSQHPQLLSQRSLGEEREKDDSITVVVMDRQRLTTSTPPTNNQHRHYQGRTLEPVLNTRMKILNASIRGGSSSSSNGNHHHHINSNYATHSSRTPSRTSNTVDNFSLRPKEDHNLVVTRTRECRIFDRAVFRNALYIAAIAFCFVTAILVIFSPTSPSPSLQTNFIRDPHPSSGPGVSLCLPIPFSRSKLLTNRVEPSLAAFVMYAISPFNPAGKALEEQGETHEALSSLTTKYRKLLSRIVSSRQLVQHQQSGELRRLLRTLTPTCQEVLTSCRLNGVEVSGSNCCRSVLSRTEFTLRHGLCFSADNLSSVRLEGVSLKQQQQQNAFFFPITERSIPISFSMKLNSTNLATLTDIKGSDQTQNQPSFKVVLNSKRGTGFGSSEASQMDVRSGQAVAMTLGKRAVDNRRPFDFFAGGGACHDSEEEDLKFGLASIEDGPKEARRTRRARVQKQRRADCRSSAVQAIAEKSVNCSLLSLPRASRDASSLPLCGPLEGLALTYILREQGALLRADPRMRATFESSLRQTCPTSTCYEEIFEQRVTRVAEIKSSLSSSTVELEYRPKEFISVRRFGPGIFEEAIRKFGSLCGICSAVILAVVFLRRVCGGSKGLFSKRKATVDL